MSYKTADNIGDTTALPEFMSEKNNNQNNVIIEEGSSWLNNNLHKLMIGISVIWFAVVLIYITQFFGWSNLFLMMPDEFGGFLAGVTLPLAIIWVVMAYIDRGSSFKQEAKFLRAYMNQLVYPEDKAPQTAKAMADAIRSQVVELQQVSRLAHEQTSQIKDAIKNNVDDFAKLVAKLDNYSTKTIVELSDGVKFLMANFDNILNKAQVSSQNLSQINREFVEGGEGIEKNLTSIFERITPKITEISNLSDNLRQITRAANSDVQKTAEYMNTIVTNSSRTFDEYFENMEKQSAHLKQTADMAMTNCNLVKNTMSKEIANLENVLHDQSQRMTLIVEESGIEINSKIDEVIQKTEAHIENINVGVEKAINNIDNNVENQIQKLDSSLSKHNHEINAFIKALDDKTDDVNKKFVSYSDNVAQEIDKLMVRTSNLEDSIGLQVANIKDVSIKAIDSMQNVETALSDNISILDKKVALANNDIISYVEKLNEKSQEFETISNDSSDKIVDLTDVLNKRYSELQKIMASGLNQLQQAEKDVANSAENLIVQTHQSTESLNQVSQLMQKHTAGLTEASSIVVTQSQISEASMSQQQKHITDTAARVEEIKNELKRQIDDLTNASAILEKDAVNVLDMLKTNISKMLNQCNETITKSKIINDNLSEQANQFDVSANQTLTKVNQFENVLIKQSQNIEMLANNISEKTEAISKSLDERTQKLDEVTTFSDNLLSKSIDEFNKKGEAVNEISKSASEYINSAISGLDEKAATITIMFKQQENNFYEYCSKVSENTNKMAEILRKQVASVEEGADKLFAKLVVLEEDTERKTESVVINSQKSVQELVEIEKLLTEKHQLAEKTVDDTIEKFGGISNIVNQHIQNFENNVNNIKTNIGETVQEISDGEEKLKVIYKELAENANNSWKNLQDHTVYIENMGVKLLSQNERIADALNTQKNNISEVVNNLITQVRLGEASMAQQFKYLTDATVDVATKMQEINASFKNNTGEIFDVTTKLSYEFDVLGDRLLKDCDAINKASKESIKNIDQTSLRLNQSCEDLDTSIFHSIENINGVFKEYEKYIAGFNTVTAETSTGVFEINNLISLQSDKMVQISQDTKKLVDCFNNVLNDTSNQLADRANDAYDKVKSLGQDLKKLGMEMDEATKMSAIHLEKSSDKLRASISEAATNAERISNNILSSGEIFVKQSQALTAIADDTAQKVNTSVDNLVKAGKIFEVQGQSIVKEAIRFNDTVNNQTKILDENTKKADKTMKELIDSYKDIKVDTFLKDAGKIISALENISVDVNRLLHPKDEDDLWKKFYNGDTQVFIRYIVKNMNSAQVALLRREFEKNVELRKLVINYLKEFETLVEKSKSHEHSAALMAIISDADLGKLYYIIAKAMDKIK
ncbi:MAG: hypothetical protein IKC10_02620 [Alphaproteobacteria bacterium]|nr:hypothetical protein [Alphaproteobacteria bacterium]